METEFFVGRMVVSVRLRGFQPAEPERDPDDIVQAEDNSQPAAGSLPEAECRYDYEAEKPRLEVAITRG
jgi:hypothetical protein